MVSAIEQRLKENIDDISSFERGIKYCSLKIKNKNTPKWEKKEYKSVMLMNRANILKIKKHNQVLKDLLKGKL